MMKIAIPIEANRLHHHFGGTRHFVLVEADPQSKTVLRTETVPAPEHQPGAFPRWLYEQGVQVVIADGIGRRALANFALYGIAARAGIANSSVADLVTAYLEGRLTSSPDGCEHQDSHGDACSMSHE